MKTVSVRGLREVLARLEHLLEVEGEIRVARRGRSIARLLPVSTPRKAPSHKSLRDAMPRMEAGSEDLVRSDREGR